MPLQKLLKVSYSFFFKEAWVLIDPGFMHSFTSFMLAYEHHLELEPLSYILHITMIIVSFKEQFCFDMILMIIMDLNPNDELNLEVST